MFLQYLPDGDVGPHQVFRETGLETEKRGIRDRIDENLTGPAVFQHHGPMVDHFARLDFQGSGNIFSRGGHNLGKRGHGYFIAGYRLKKGGNRPVSQEKNGLEG
jgi:hypothetical protein